ncbi:hypothetical protein Barb6XT_02997 [Bacteroidales bacterium Barb6XT]|nr:hypothetical protein Barb6XT_02997 [Bacteroidales bacterium Barb6XT]
MLNPHHFERLFMDLTNNLKDSGAAEKVTAVDEKTVFRLERQLLQHSSRSFDTCPECRK